MANGSLGKYARYAGGEILLVVIGILIALQINNWNEDRIEQRQIREYALSLVGDLQRDMEMVEPVAQQIDSLRHLCSEMSAYMQDKDIDQISNIDLFVYMRSPSYRPFAWNRAALDQLKSSGALRQIRNQELVRRISEYDALTRHLDQDYTNDENNIREASYMALEVVDINYPEADRLPDYVNSGDSERLDEFFRSERYIQIKRNDLPLLTDDINTVRQAANNYIMVGRLLSARTDSEIPRLRQIAEEIIELVGAEYGH